MLNINSNGELVFGNSIFYQDRLISNIKKFFADSLNQLWLVGHRISSRQLPDMVFYVVDEAGQVVWNDHYNMSADSSDTTEAADTDLSGNVYVAGYSSTPSGGQKLVLLKYATTTINKQASGNIFLQFPGEPGKQLKIEATPTLTTPDWTQIGLGQVPTNGLFQLEDTNASSFPSRFYRAVSMP